ncbi:MAG TPA: polysaccharide biosynthesis/export family protein [Stellaceae bacterium]|nr:polysaccharide biosynthesis/export family protein [Stellaceae bacterium]
MCTSLYRWLSVLVIALPIAACSSQGSDLPPLESTGSGVDSQYRLGAGDKLRIQVLGADDLTGEYGVSDNGTISSPLIGEVKAAGLTRAELEKAMAKKLAEGYIKNPRVSVTVLTYRPFYIFGEITKPGEYPYASGMRVQNAVALAGGYTYRANQNFVVVSRDGQEHKATGNTPIRPDDVIKVPERFF